jgi:DNA-binding NarL/FixJ family response regulator
MMTMASQPETDRPLASALIVDDHPLFCDALSMTLKSVAGIAEIESADRLETAIRRVDLSPAPDVILLDLNLPDVNGIDGLIRLRQAAAGVPVVVVSSLADDRVIGACLAAGAAGFVPKHSRREVFRAAFEALRAGRRFLPEGYEPPPEGKAQGTARGTAREEAIGRLALLTRQQARILQLICEGLLNKQIAYELSIAETTVKAHVTAIMRKLGVQSRTQAVLIARETNFASLMPEGG